MREAEEMGEGGVLLCGDSDHLSMRNMVLLSSSRVA